MLATDLALQFVTGRLLQPQGFVECALGLGTAAQGEKDLAPKVVHAGTLRVDGCDCVQRPQRFRELALILVNLRQPKMRGAQSGCVAKTILSSKPNQPPISSVDYSAFNPRISRMN
jgi:hypothetical protein